MTTDNLEKFQQKFQTGKAALERGNYRLSIENLKAAQEFVAVNSRRGGEAGIWLVTAYQAANKITEAIALCQELIVHPDTQTREQAQRILYIIKAPRLERPKEWMSEIPDLGNSEAGLSRYVAAKQNKSHSSASTDEDSLDLSPKDAADNQFIWFALLLVMVMIGSLFWLNNG